MVLNPYSIKINAKILNLLFYRLQSLIFNQIGLSFQYL